jgi:hypothetical protein
MPRTILCQKCGVVLNLPTNIDAGKRMKCPKCSHRFTLSEKDASSISTVPGSADADEATQDLGQRPGSHVDLPVASTGGDLRDLFDSPLGTGASIEHQAASDRAPVMSDAEALFHDEPVRKRKPKGAEARAQARRCTTCRGVVPVGMSICPSCGVDQETGIRVDLDDFAPPPPPPPSGPPIHIAVTGLLCGLGATILLVMALVQSIRAEPGVPQYGWLCLSLVSAFGIYGAVQFFIGRSVKFLMLALTLGVFVDFVSMIVLPIVEANLVAQDTIVEKVENNNADDPDTEDVVIKPISERIDQSKISVGLTVIFLYVLLSIYLMSPPVKKYFIRRQAMTSDLPLL